MLKGRSSSQRHINDIREFLLIRYLNLTPAELVRLPYADKLKYSMIIDEMMKSQPMLLGINASVS